MRFYHAEVRQLQLRLSAQLDRKRLVMQRPNVHYGKKVLELGLVMDELIGRLVADVGDARAAVGTGVGIILDFLVKEGPADKMRLLLAKLPGAARLTQKAASESGGIMGASVRMMGAGLSMGQGMTRQFIAYAREKVGEDEVDDIAGASPSLAQFV
ncbi:MAG: DUF2267 domain-containing protein [Xanthobacteraceae bacterium]